MLNCPGLLCPVVVCFSTETMAVQRFSVFLELKVINDSALKLWGGTRNKLFFVLKRISRLALWWQSAQTLMTSHRIYGNPMTYGNHTVYISSGKSYCCTGNPQIRIGGQILHCFSNLCFCVPGLGFLVMLPSSLCSLIWLYIDGLGKIP